VFENMTCQVQRFKKGLFMKRFVTSCVMAIALIICAITVSAYNFENNSFLKTGYSLQTENTYSGQHFDFQNNIPFSSPYNEQIKNENKGDSEVVKVLIPTNGYRISHSLDLTLNQLLTSNKTYLNQISNKQTDGFYLFFLCKMLI